MASFFMVRIKGTLALGESEIDGQDDAPKEVLLFVVGKTTPIVSKSHRGT
jgi:hypothetical protein